MAESNRNLASTLGGGEATLYRDSGSSRQQEIVFMERSMGLPVKITGAGMRFIVLDGEGGITWHDSQTGKLLAVFRLYTGTWSLEKINPASPLAGKEIIQGRTVRK
jgi:hypothetical protein